MQGINQAFYNEILRQRAKFQFRLVRVRGEGRGAFSYGGYKIQNSFIYIFIRVYVEV